MNKHKRKRLKGLFQIERALNLITGDRMKPRDRQERILNEIKARQELITSLEAYSVGKMKFKDLPERVQKKLGNMKITKIRDNYKVEPTVPSQAPYDDEPCPTPCPDTDHPGEGATRPNCDDRIDLDTLGRVSIHNPDNPEPETQPSYSGDKYPNKNWDLGLELEKLNNDDVPTVKKPEFPEDRITTY